MTVPECSMFAPACSKYYAPMRYEANGLFFMLVFQPVGVCDWLRLFRSNIVGITPCIGVICSCLADWLAFSSWHWRVIFLPKRIICPIFDHPVLILKGCLEKPLFSLLLILWNSVTYGKQVPQPEGGSWIPFSRSPFEVGIGDLLNLFVCPFRILRRLLVQKRSRGGTEIPKLAQ